MRNTVRVRAATADPHPANDRARTRVTVAPLARLRLHVHADRPAVRAGRPLAYRILVRATRAIARGVRVCVRAPLGVAFVHRHHTGPPGRHACRTLARRLKPGTRRVLHLTARTKATTRSRTITLHAAARARNAHTRHAHARIRIRPAPPPPHRGTR